MNRILTGQIVKNDVITGTGFLITENVVMTAKHTILKAEEILDMQEVEEVKVQFMVAPDDIVEGITINLREAEEKGIDCVFIRLRENLCEEKPDSLVISENGLAGSHCKMTGYPKLADGRMELSGNITCESENKIMISVKKEDELQNYEGLSGAPVIVFGAVVGMIVRQESNEKLEALSVEYIRNNLNCGEIPVRNRAISVNISEDVCNMEKQIEKNRQVIEMAGPRYSVELNVQTELKKHIQLLLRKDGKYSIKAGIEQRGKQCIRHLNEFLQYGQEKEELLLKEHVEKTRSITENLTQSIEQLNKSKTNVIEVRKMQKKIENDMQVLKEIFTVEKERFEERHGTGTFDNKSWKGWQASYMCEFPTRYLDELKSAMEELPWIIKEQDIERLSVEENQVILITGQGGIGKTHLLCDIVNQYCSEKIPSVLMFGDMFPKNVAADEVILNQMQPGCGIDEYFEWLNAYSEENDWYLPICIDAINETDDPEYWNRNLPLLCSKIQKYPGLKLILSCRSLYLREYLEEEKFRGILQLTHKGFEKQEEEALAGFCEYYGVTINYETVFVPEFMNPLFLKMLCEIAQDKKDKTVVVNDIGNLMEEFFALKNKRISRKYSDYFSVRDEVVQKILSSVMNEMMEQERYTISWTKFRECVTDVLKDFEMQGKASGIMKSIISENLLREANDSGTEIAFSYQKFFEYQYACAYEAKHGTENISILEKDIQEQRITAGTLEMLQIAYFSNTGEELLDHINESMREVVAESFVSGLYWRSREEIGAKTIDAINGLLSSGKESEIRTAIAGLLAVATKSECAVNALFIHEKLCALNPYRRDYILSFFLLKQYDQMKVLSDLCERAISLSKRAYSLDNVFLWEIILGWGTGNNDRKLRDKASKGLTNLLRLYPETMTMLSDQFAEVEDDYIHERMWQAIYSALILISEESRVHEILTYITENIVNAGLWPQNVLIRDYLRNIFEYAYYREWCSKEEVERVRPPYKSRKHIPNEEWAANYKTEYHDLFRNCQTSDFAIYSIPYEVSDYGLTKKQVGMMIFEDIIRSGYHSNCREYDSYIDYTYGSLRNRDEQVERIGKKYQKIYLYREMGNIYDNYPYKPRYETDDIEVAAPEQGNSFREIDLTIRPLKNEFVGAKLVYPFYRYSQWNDREWFDKNDIEKYIPGFLKTEYEGEEYYVLQSYQSVEEPKKKEYRMVWLQIRTYFYEKEKKEQLLKWFEKKNFDGRWMPEGAGQMYSNCLGEYPWSPDVVNYLGEEEEQSFRHEKPAPCYLIATVNDYIAEKDSQFCTNEDISYMLPADYLMDEMELQWDGAYGYSTSGEKVIYMAENNAMFIKKKYLQSFLAKKNLDIVWTVLGEKQKITENSDFPGSAEFSYTYRMDDIGNPIRNHEVYETREPIYR